MLTTCPALTRLAALVGLGAAPMLMLACTANLADASSGFVGCPASEITISDERIGSVTSTWTAACRGNVFYCSQAATHIGGGTSQYQCHPAASQASFYTSRAPAPPPRKEAPVPKKNFPEKALGFTFASVPEVAQAACSSQGHEWQGSGDAYACSGTGVDVGVPIHAKLSYCGDTLCEVRAFATLAEGSAGSQQLVKLRKALLNQYGKPDVEQTEIPTECRETLMACIIEGKASWNATWEWSDGSLIRARAGSDGGAAVIGILYRHDQEARDIHEATETLNADAF